MKKKIRIKTPKGEATKAQKNIRRFIFGMKKVKVETYVNKEDSEMFWDVEGSVRKESQTEAPPTLYN